MIRGRAARVKIVVVSGVALAQSLLLSPATAGADNTCTTFSAVAAADGARISYNSVGFLVVETVDGGAPAAQAAVDGLGNSTAYAGYPYPSDAVYGTLLGGMQDAYPLTVSSRHPQHPVHESSVGPVKLEARSEKLESVSAASATAVAGQPGMATQGRTIATGRARCAPDGTVEAESRSSAEGARFADVLTVGAVESVARAVAGRDGRTKAEASLTVADIRIADVRLALTEGELLIAGSRVPLPESPLADLLADAGLGIRYVAGQQDQDGRGVVAPALEITVTRTGLGPRPTTVGYTFGRSYARVVSAPVASASVGPLPDLGPPVDSDNLSSSAVLTATEGKTEAAKGESPPPPALSSPVIGTGLRGAAPMSSSGSSYFALMISATVLLSAVLFLRKLGVQLR